MKYFAQFFIRSAIDNDKIIEGCGDRAVIILDGRITKKLMGEISAHECQKRGFVAWQIHEGDFRESKPISQIWYVSESKPIDSPSWLSAHSM
jgi:hypothetical protein